jgi:uncharacterized repeat protein (TIGR01451 family)
MKTHRWFLAVALAAAWLAGAALGQNTVGGTVIENTATATFVDSNDVARSTFSNTVETIVQTVYAFDVAPDDGRAPTPVSDFGGYTETDGLNDASGAIGDTVEFLYAITNGTNNGATDPVNLSLSVAQDGADDFDLVNVTIEVSFDGGATYVAYVPADGLDLTAQGQEVLVRVRGVIPAGVDGNDVALVDLVAINDGAATSGQAGPNASFDTNNFARATVAENPVIGVAKEAATITNNGDGTYTVAYEITVRNYGNVPLSGVQVVEDLAATFPLPATFVVDGVVATGSLDADATFDGDAAQDLLVAGSSTLPIGATETVTLTVTVTPGADLGPYDNQVAAGATSPNGVPVTDLSTEGTDPDQNGAVGGNDGDGDPTNTDSLTPVLFAEDPQIGLAKAATAAVDAVGFPGQFESTITLTLVNDGDVELRDVQVTDALTATFPAPAGFVVSSAPVAVVTVAGSGGSSALTGNAAFDGDTVITLLTAGNTLAAGATATITFTIRFDPGGLTGPFDNTAATTATSPAGTPVSDDSANGTDPDTDGNGDPTDDASPTPISFTEDPIVGLAKNLDAVVDAPGAPGQFDVTFTFTVRNYGNVDLNDVQISDNLAATFAAPATIVSVGTPTSATLTVNPGFTGAAPNTGLLAGTDTLRPAESATVTVTVRIDPNGVASFDNVATAGGTSPGGAAAIDTSHDGLDPAPGVGSDPRDFADATPILIPEAPLLGVAKNLEGFVNNGDGSYTATYLVTVANYGNVPLSSVQVTEDFAATFAGAPIANGAVTATTGGLTANPGFTGAAPHTALLSGADSLAVGATGTITVVVTVTPGADLGPYGNQVGASAASPGGAPVSDLSTDGTDPDQGGDVPGDDGDGDPTNTDSATPVTFTERPLLGVAKAATPGVDAPGFPGEFLTTITLTLENFGDVELRNVQVTDVLSATFPTPVTYVVTGAPSSATLAGNALFDGTAGAGANVLVGSDTLAPGATATVSFTVRFDPNGQTGPFDNTAVASGTSPAGTPVSDDSFPGADPDPDGNGDPTDDAAVTPITFTEVPRIGVAKDGSVIDFGNTDPNLGALGPFTIRIDFLLRNYGNVALTNVTLTDDLDAAFGAGNYAVTAGPSVQSVSVGSVVNVNAGYDGGTDVELVADGSGSSLAIGGQAVVRIEVVVYAAGTYVNQGTGTGRGPGGTTTSDDSTSGVDPDPDGNGDPSDNDVPTTWSVDQLALAKSARTCADAACTSVLDAVGATVEPGQYLEYTIVGGATGALTDLMVTDAIPADTIFVLNTISAGGACSTDGGASYGACPVVASGPYADANDTVTHVRWTEATLSDGASLTWEFVVRVR